jgi:NAD(P)-dependent dehydrogenase (short-subunit alcohol dehydrogenase family)
VVASLPGTGHRALHIPMLETKLIRDAAATVQATYGRCDVLVNCAGFTRMVPHQDLDALDDDLIDAIFAANVRGPFATIRAFVRLLKKSGDAAIVNISSVAGHNVVVAGAGAGAGNPRAHRLSGCGGHSIRAGSHDGDGGESCLDDAAEAGGAGG